eukprot:9080545-Alexandrium_andersonii.AAC.1
MCIRDSPSTARPRGAPGILPRCPGRAQPEGGAHSGSTHAPPRVIDELKCRDRRRESPWR